MPGHCHIPSFCHAPAQTPTMAPYYLCPQVQMPLYSSQDPPKLATTWARQILCPWEINLTFLNLHFVLCKMDIGVPILLDYDEDTMKRDL